MTVIAGTRHPLQLHRRERWTHNWPQRRWRIFALTRKHTQPLHYFAKTWSTWKKQHLGKTWEKQHSTAFGKKICLWQLSSMSLHPTRKSQQGAVAVEYAQPHPTEDIGLRFIFGYYLHTKNWKHPLFLLEILMIKESCSLIVQDNFDNISWIFV